ncbi:MAG: hypothetical protein F6J87_28840 [Spirulina sp. SIO3F2]|nr:hypothetical protein [Spirulina sp. SIO3F2]
MNYPQDRDRNRNNPHRPDYVQPIPPKREPDFFQQLQAKEKQKGLAVRGGGHGWTTFIEILLGDW